MNIQLSAGFVAIAMIFVAQTSQADELLSNGGFESAIGPSNSISFSNWSTFVSDPSVNEGQITNVAPNSGLSHLSLSIQGFDDAFSGVQQSESGIQAGVEYTFSGFARNEGPLGIEAEFRIEWLDAADEFVGDQFATNQIIALSMQYSQFSNTSIAPNGATQLRAVLAVQSFGDGDNFGTVFFDDISLNVPVAVPEPSTSIIFMIGLGGYALVARQR